MLRVSRDCCDSGYDLGWEHALPAPVPCRRPRPVRPLSSALNLPAALPVEHSPNLQPTAYCLQPSSAPARRPRKGDTKVRTGVRRRSGCVTGAGGEASQARNAEVCRRAGWRLRRPSAGAPSASAVRRLRRTRPNAERRRRTHGGREQVSGRSAGSTRATVVPKPMRIRGCAGLARYISARPASDTESRGLGTMLVRARQSAQPVHAAVRAQSVLGPPSSVFLPSQPVHAVRRTLFTHRFSRSANK